MARKLLPAKLLSFKIKYNCHMRHLITLMLLAGLAVCQGTLTAQHLPTAGYTRLIVTMKDGSRLKGAKLAMTDTHLVLESSYAGKLNIPLEDVAQIEEIAIEDIQDVRIRRRHFAANQMWVNFTPFGLPKGEGQYHNLMLLGNQFSYGVTDWLSLHAGTELFSSLSPLQRANLSFVPTYYLRPHASFSSSESKLTLGGGLVMMGLRRSQQVVDIWTPYLGMAWGDRNAHLYFNTGWNIGRNSIPSLFFDNPAFPLVINAGWQTRISKLVVLSNENWFFDEGFSRVWAGVLGMRLLARRSAWNMGVMYSLADGFFFVPPVPLASCTVKIGK